MYILVLTQIIPYPPDAGPRVKTWHVLRHLASSGHQVTLASFVRPEEERYLADLRRVCSAVHTIPIHRSRVSDVGYWLRSNWTGRPFLIERDDLAPMRALVNRLVSNGDIDMIHADQLGMVQFAKPFCETDWGKNPLHGSVKRPVVVFDAHNAVWTIVERMRDNAFWLLKPVAALEARRVKRYEGQIVSEFDHTLAVTEPDHKALLEAVRFYNPASAELPTGKITVAPIAVDTQLLQPVQRKPGSMNIVTLGTLHYPPNADGIRWFANEVFPLIRRQLSAVTLTIIGKNPPADFLQLAEQNPQVIQVTGYVPDLLPYMEAAALMVVAVRAGGGMRVRILEAFARAMPVVTTTVGLEGIEAQPGEDVLVQDEPAAFAEATIKLLQDAEMQSTLAANGRRLAETRYDWQVILQKMDRIYQTMID
jgi:glycosyltransferase involved in cell wall biosynthesis